ncbi:CHAT domain-containing protein [Hymenobacter artigasi]|uniref:CHAT domain-containing protein n=1 Tax=Hymenobacter artigasi TaxID=2719616 RepID=A0ABX1HMX0_9BACT|nr:CHAT domain-containing protein [Hymenobacter artigasi]NKI91599.1 hypothetical protein [Hymenobacter artigasi]
MQVPAFNTKYACIVDRKKSHLAAIISSYLQENNTFLSVFEFSSSTAEKPEGPIDIVDEHALSRTRSEEISIKIDNAIRKIGKIEYLIIAGLDVNQRSYLTFLGEYNIIEIDSIEDVDAMLGGLAFGKAEYLRVRPSEFLKGLFLAGKSGLKLKIDTTAPALRYEAKFDNGLIVIENFGIASAVTAVNYALSTNSDIEIISELPASQILNIELLIKEWQDGNNSSYTELNALLFNQLDGIDFSKYDFVTFFTEGAPYSLVIKNQLPVTYVHLNRYPALFIVNNIFFEKIKPIGSAIVFSPLFFTDEETEFVINVFKQENYWVKELIGNEASSYNIDMSIKEYPFDILHICSHGGEVKGYSNVTDFIDRDGNKHVVEYDDVISFYPNPNRNNDLIKVETKHIWRKFDGLKWKSEELKRLNYPHYVFVDMTKAINEHDDENGKYKGVPKAVVADSCAIQCNAFVYQAIFEMIAGFHAAPIIFNNTCWSWSGIVDSFLTAGTRGYIGTLWEVNNEVAKLSAEEFYKNVFKDTVANSLHKAIEKTKGTPSEDIYVYWGLHFSTLKKSCSIENSRLNIAEFLMKGFYRWRRNGLGMPDGFVKSSSIELSEWNLNELRRYFIKESIEIMEKRKKNQQ